MKIKQLLMTAIFAAFFATLPATGLAATGGSGGLAAWSCIPAGECTCTGRTDCKDMKDTLDCVDTVCSEGASTPYNCSCTRRGLGARINPKVFPRNKLPIQTRPGKIGRTQPKRTINAPPKRTIKTLPLKKSK